MFLTSFLSVPALVLSCVYIIAYFNALVNSFFKTFSSFFKFFYFCFSEQFRNSEQFDNDNYYQFTAMERRRSWLPPTPIILSLHMLLYALYITHIIYLLVFIIFILYRSVFHSRAIRSYSFPVNISAQYSLVGLLYFLRRYHRNTRIIYSAFYNYTICIIAVIYLYYRYYLYKPICTAYIFTALYPFSVLPILCSSIIYCVHILIL